MKFKRLIVCLFLVLVASLLPLRADRRAADLPERYKKWLNEEVPYIIAPKEKEVFLKLETDRERDIFIDAFWKIRDPSPETDKNEFKDEHYQRIQYANQWYGRGTTTRGWKTDRGKVYIILGKPRSTESFGQTGMVVPTEVWFYQDVPGRGGLPSTFYVVFFQPNDVGDFILYSPVRHGPSKLLESYQDDPKYAYSYLKNVDRTLADISISLIPGDTQPLGTMAPTPSLASEIMLQSISVYPQKQIDESYAEKLLKYKEIIEVDHSVNYVGNDFLVIIMPNDSGYSLVHYAVEPERLSVAMRNGKYSVELKAFGKITDEKNKTIYQFEKAIPLEFGPENLDELKTKRFSFQDVFPLIPGSYQFDMLLKNSVSGEFSSFERKITVPDSYPDVRISPLILSFREKTQDDGMRGIRPFQFGRIQLYPTAQMIFATREVLFVYFKIMGLSRERSDQAMLRFTIAADDKTVLDEQNKPLDLASGFGFLKRFPLDKIPPGMYTLTVSLADGGSTLLATERDNFVVSPYLSVPRAWSLSKIFPEEGDPYYMHILGVQYLNRGAVDKAVVLLEGSLRDRPGSLQFALSLIQACFLRKDYKKILDIAGPFMNQAAQEPALHFYVGKASQALGDYAGAASHYRDYLAHFGTHLGVLNSLGECYDQLGDKAQARKIWEKSLEIDPRQENIRDRLEKIKRGRLIP